MCQQWRPCQTEKNMLFSHFFDISKVIVMVEFNGPSSPNSQHVYRRTHFYSTPLKDLEKTFKECHETFWYCMEHTSGWVQESVWLHALDWKEEDPTVRLHLITAPLPSRALWHSSWRFSNTSTCVLFPHIRDLQTDSDDTYCQDLTNLNVENTIDLDNANIQKWMDSAEHLHTLANRPACNIDMCTPKAGQTLNNFIFLLTTLFQRDGEFTLLQKKTSGTWLEKRTAWPALIVLTQDMREKETFKKCINDEARKEGEPSAGAWRVLPLMSQRNWIGKELNASQNCSRSSSSFPRDDMISFMSKESSISILEMKQSSAKHSMQIQPRTLRPSSPDEELGSDTIPQEWNEESTYCNHNSQWDHIVSLKSRIPKFD